MKYSLPDGLAKRYMKQEEQATNGTSQEHLITTPGLSAIRLLPWPNPRLSKCVLEILDASRPQYVFTHYRT